MGKQLDLMVTLYRTEGPGAVIRRLAFRFLHVHTFLVLRLRLSDTLARGEIPQGIELRETSLEELKTLRGGRTDLPEYFYRDQGEMLDRCWVGLEGGRLGFIIFISYRGSSHFVRIGDKEAEVAFVYCMPELRGKRLSVNALLVIARALHVDGVTSLWAVAHQGNPAMIKSFLACGFVKVGSIKRFGFFTWPRAPVDYSRIEA